MFSGCVSTSGIGSSSVVSDVFLIGSASVSIATSCLATTISWSFSGSLPVSALSFSVLVYCSIVVSCAPLAVSLVLSVVSSSFDDTTFVSGIAALFVDTVVSSAFSSVASFSYLLSMSVKSTPSFSTIVSNCAKGLFTSSFIVASGVNDTLSCPSINTRSPVFTFTLSRGLTACTLNVPSPFTLTSLSVLSPSFITSNIAETNFSASLTVILCFLATVSAISCSAVFAITQPLLSLAFLL